MAFMYTTTIGMYELIRARALIIYELTNVPLSWTLLFQSYYRYYHTYLL